MMLLHALAIVAGLSLGHSSQSTSLTTILRACIGEGPRISRRFDYREVEIPKRLEDLAQEKGFSSIYEMLGWTEIKEWALVDINNAKQMASSSLKKLKTMDLSLQEKQALWKFSAEVSSSVSSSWGMREIPCDECYLAVGTSPTHHDVKLVPVIQIDASGTVKTKLLAEGLSDDQIAAEFAPN